jgi:hypothetical protein
MQRTHCLALAASILAACSPSSGSQSKPGDAGTTDSGTPASSSWPIQFGSDMYRLTGVTTDKNGNVFVVGNDQDAENQGSVSKYSPDAKLVTAFDVVTSVKGEDVNAYGIAPDPTGEFVYVAGSGPQTEMGQLREEPLLAAFDVTMTKLEWIEELSTMKIPETPSDGGTGSRLTVDLHGNIDMLGYSDSPILSVSPHTIGRQDLFVVQYDKAGKVNWIVMMGSGKGDFPGGIATDSNGDIYLVGEVSGTIDGLAYAGGLGDIYVAKLDGASGKTLWEKDEGGSGEDVGVGIAVDAKGNAYVAGYTDGSLDGNKNAGFNDIVLLKYDTNGNKQWSREIGSTSDDSAAGVALDPTGLPIVGGQTEGDFDGHQNADRSMSNDVTADIVALKYDASGNKLWSDQFGSEDEDDVWGIATDPSGNIFLGGTTAGSIVPRSNAPAFVVRYLPTGKM